jgi:hypothetical protein
MKKALFVSLLASALVVTMLFTGCDGWTTNDAGFNTSEGAGATINFSGFYKGYPDGSRAVKNTSAGNIVSMTIQQGGAGVEVHDNQGSVYSGNVGSPGAVSPSSSGGYSAGAELVQAQINFSGHDNVANKEISFAGVFHAVAITDITKSDSSEEGSQITTSETSDNTNRVVTTTETVGAPSDPFYRVTVTTVTYNIKTGEEISRTVKESGSTSFSLTEANTQYRLQGTWVEEGGVVSDVDAISPGSAGVITTTTSTTTP